VTDWELLNMLPMDSIDSVAHKLFTQTNIKSHSGLMAELVKTSYFNKVMLAILVNICWSLQIHIGDSDRQMKLV
jgi:hypothetical protein